MLTRSQARRAHATEKGLESAKSSPQHGNRVATKKSNNKKPTTKKSNTRKVAKQSNKRKRKTMRAEQTRERKQPLNPYIDQLDEWLSGTPLARLREVQPACVFVDSEEEIGSGVYIASRGLVLTAGHCAGAIGEERTIEFPDHASSGIFRATCTAMSDDYDLALLTICGKQETKRKKFTPPKMACPKLSKTPAKVGDRIVIIGQPGKTRGLRQEPAIGQVTSVLKDPLAGQWDKGGLGHNAFVVAGHSGGPLFNLAGEIVGVHTTAVWKGVERAAVTLEAVRAFLRQYQCVDLT